MRLPTLGRIALGFAPLVLAASAQAQSASVQIAPPSPPAAIPAPPPLDGEAAPAIPVGPQGGTVLQMRGLDKITGRPTNISAPIGRPVRFATLTITARFCYSTPPSETPETAAFVQVEDRRPDQPARRIFSGWMYASSPGLNAVEHPLYDVWALSCNNAPPSAVAAASTAVAPVKVKAPDSSDREGVAALPEGAGQ